MRSVRRSVTGAQMPLQRWLRNGALIVATSALERAVIFLLVFATGQDFDEIWDRISR